MLLFTLIKLSIYNYLINTPCIKCHISSSSIITLAPVGRGLVQLCSANFFTHAKTEQALTFKNLAIALNDNPWAYNHTALNFSSSVLPFYLVCTNCFYTCTSVLPLQILLLCIYLTGISYTYTSTPFLHLLYLFNYLINTPKF